MSALRFLVALWRSACRPAIFRRCAMIAGVVGTLLSVVNQTNALMSGRVDLAVGLRIVANYLIPFIVSNLGAMTSLPPSERS